MNNFTSEAPVISLQWRMIACGTKIPFAKIADLMLKCYITKHHG